MKYVKKISVCLFGLLLYGSGMFLNIKANIGLSPWSAFAMGISNVTGILYGNASVAIGVVLIFFDILLKENIGIGSILNAILVGKIVDILEFLGVVPMIENYLAGVGVLILGQILIAVGSYFYMSAELGCGPRDSLMLAFDRRITKLPIGVIRSSMELIVTVIGGLLGAKIGLGTLLCVITIGFFIQMVFKLFRYDASMIEHENLMVTYRQIFKHRKNQPE